MTAGLRARARGARRPSLLRVTSIARRSTSGRRAARGARRHAHRRRCSCASRSVSATAGMEDTDPDAVHLGHLHRRGSGDARATCIFVLRPGCCLFPKPLRPLAGWFGDLAALRVLLGRRVVWARARHVGAPTGPSSRAAVDRCVHVLADLILPISFGLQALRLVLWRFGWRADQPRCTSFSRRDRAPPASIDITTLLFGSFIILLILGVPIGHALGAATLMVLSRARYPRRVPAADRVQHDGLISARCGACSSCCVGHLMEFGGPVAAPGEPRLRGDRT